MTAGRTTNSLSQNWGTPKKYVYAVREFFNDVIHFDPCSNEYSIVNAEREVILPEDGLRVEWNYPTIYVNPPYGSDKQRKTTIKHWLAKCAEANEKYNSEVLALIPIAANTTHWKKYVFPKATAICFLYDTRLKFLESGLDVGKGAPMACSIVYWGKDFDLFFSKFIKFGAVVDVRHLHHIEIGQANNTIKLDLQHH